MTSPADHYALLCNEDEQLPDVFEYIASQDDLSGRETVNILLVDQYQRWKRQQAIPVDHYFERTPDIDDTLKVDLLVEEFGYLEQRGVAPAPEEFVKRYHFLSNDALESICDSLDVQWDDDSGPSSSPSEKTSRNGEQPANIGRYQIVRLIGRGAFGEVFLAKDPQLQRSVAIKIPTSERIQIGGGTDEFLNEARAVAGLDHPNIVPVYDVGLTEDGRCFVVSKYVKGKELRKELRKGFSYDESARIIALLAKALHVAHQSDIVHRDVKPGNIVIDQERNPHLLDFGLSLRGFDGAQSKHLAGTPAYMSPEQAAGNSASIDGRSDIYSLGVVLYEMLTGKRPFRSDDPNEIINLVKNGDVRPPRQVDDQIPAELERICIKALSRNAIDRYNTASDFATELDSYRKSASIEKSLSKSVASASQTGSAGTGNNWRLALTLAVAAGSLILIANQFGLLDFSAPNGDANANLNTSNIEVTKTISKERPGRISVLGFRNVAASENTDWIGVGFTELLRSELEKSDDLMVDSRSQVQQLRNDLEIADLEALGSSSLSRIRRRQGTEYVVSGSYSPVGSDFKDLKLQIIVQDTGTNEVISEFSQEFGRDDWSRELPQIASRIRKDMSLLPLDLMKTGQLASAQPKNELAAESYFKGIESLLDNDYESAKQFLNEAIKIEPESAIVHDLLADVCTDIGDDKKALQHAVKAFEMSENSSPKLRKRIASRYHLLNGEPFKSVAIRQELFSEFRSIETAILLGQAMIAAGQAADAVDLAEEIKNSLAGDADTARLNMTISDAAQSVSNFSLQIQTASLANEAAKSAASDILQAEALLRWGLGLQRLGKNTDAVSKLSLAFEFFSHQSNDFGAGKAKAALSKVFVDQGILESAEAALQEALEFANSSQNLRLQTQILGQQGELLIYQGKFAEATKKLEEARERFIEQGDRLNSAGMSLTLANVVARSGNFDRARELIVEARESFQAAGNRQGQARTWGQQGAIYGRSGESVQARKHFERALELFREVGDRVGEATCLGDLGNTYSSAGNLQKASELMSQALEIHRQVESRHGSTTITYNLGVLYIRTGRTNAGLQLLEESFETFQKQGNRMNACFVQRKIGDLMMRVGRMDDASATLESSLAAARKIGSKAVESHALASLGTFQLHRGDPSKGVQLIEQANEIREKLKLDGNIADAKLVLANLAIREGRIADAEKLVISAEQTFSQNKKSYFWIQQAIKGQVLAMKKEGAAAKKVLDEFQDFMNHRESQDVEVGLRLKHNHARLLAALGQTEAAIKAFEVVIASANNQSNVLTKLMAQLDLAKFKRSIEAPIPINDLDDWIASASQHGLNDIANQLTELR